MDLRLRRRWRLALLGMALVLVGRFGMLATAHDVATAVGAVVEPLRFVPTRQPAVALTFDVEWGERQPLAVLKALRQKRVHATFFVAGPWARTHPDVVRALVADGQEVDSLGDRSIRLSRYPASVVREEVRQAAITLVRLTGRWPQYLRPPQGDWNPAIVALANREGSALVLWNLDALDWLNPGVDYVVARVERRAAPGDVIRLSAGDGATQTAAALPAIIGGLQRRGLRLVTLGQLVALAAH